LLVKNVGIEQIEIALAVPGPVSVLGAPELDELLDKLGFKIAVRFHSFRGRGHIILTHRNRTCARGPSPAPYAAKAAASPSARPAVYPTTSRCSPADSPSSGGYCLLSLVQHRSPRLQRHRGWRNP